MKKQIDVMVRYKKIPKEDAELLKRDLDDIKNMIDFGLKNGVRDPKPVDDLPF